jgi:hypothetical protein
MAAIPGLTFSPWVDHKGARSRGCNTCDHWWGEFTKGSHHIVCEKDYPWHHVPGDAKNGCAFWMRAIGSDDE